MLNKLKYWAEHNGPLAGFATVVIMIVVAIVFQILGNVYL